MAAIINWPSPNGMPMASGDQAFPSTARQTSPDARYHAPTANSAFGSSRQEAKMPRLNRICQRPGSIHKLSGAKRANTNVISVPATAAGRSCSQLLPAAVAGTLITFVLARFAPESLWMLPGLWQILFSLGIFASCRLLPKALFAVGAWYLASGLVCLAVDGNAWSPLAMGIPFGLGQLMMAAILHRALGGVDGED